MGQHGGRARNSPQFLSTFYNMSAVGSSYLLLDWHFIGVFFSFFFSRPTISWRVGGGFHSQSSMNTFTEEDAAELRINYVKHKVKQKDQDPELDHAAWEQVPRVSRRINKRWR